MRNESLQKVRFGAEASFGGTAPQCTLILSDPLKCPCGEEGGGVSKREQSHQGREEEGEGGRGVERNTQRRVNMAYSSACARTTEFFFFFLVVVGCISGLIVLPRSKHTHAHNKNFLFHAVVGLACCTGYHRGIF